MKRVTVSIPSRGFVSFLLAKQFAKAASDERKAKFQSPPEDSFLSYEKIKTGIIESVT